MYELLGFIYSLVYEIEYKFDPDKHRIGQVFICLWKLNVETHLKAIVLRLNNLLATNIHLRKNIAFHVF